MAILSEQALIERVLDTCAAWAAEEVQLNAADNSPVTVQQRYAEHVASFIEALQASDYQPDFKQGE